MAVSVAATLLVPAAALWPSEPPYAAPPLPDVAAPDGGQSPPASDRLQTLAAALTDDGGSAPAVQEVCFEQWSMDTTDPAAQIVVQHHQMWRNPDGSGHTITTTDGVARRDEYLAGGLAPLIPEPLATDPAALYRQLAEYHEPPENGPQVMARGFVELSLQYRLTAAERRAALAVLAGVDGLRYAGTAPDRLGRLGAVYTIDSQRHDIGGQTRDLLIISGDGHLLEHDLIALIAPERFSIAPGTVIAYNVMCL